MKLVNIAKRNVREFLLIIAFLLGMFFILRYQQNAATNYTDENLEKAKHEDLISHGSDQNHNSDFNGIEQSVKKSSSWKSIIESIPIESRPSFTIHVFTWRRLVSLERLLFSLYDCEFFDIAVDLLFHIDGQYNQGVHDLCESVEWPYGKKTLIVSEERKGIERAVMEAWEPINSNDYAFFFEDDIELSRYFFEWTLKLLYKYVLSIPKEKPKFIDSLIGISLYSPRFNEIETKLFNSNEVIGIENSAYGLQLPCSWGALYFPQPWSQFRHYYNTLNRFGGIDDEIVFQSKSNHWSRSWKKYLIDFMYLNGYILIYPQLPGGYSLSTNHMEAGEHTGPNGLPSKIKPMKNELITVPLLKQPLNETIRSELPLYEMISILNIYHEKVPTISSLRQEGFNRLLQLTQFHNSMEVVFSEALSQTPYLPTFLQTKPSSSSSSSSSKQRQCILDYLIPSSTVLSFSESESAKYILFQPQGGFNNQLESVADAYFISQHLNRTLILPPLCHSSESQIQQCVPLSTLFSLDHLVNVVELKDFLKTTPFKTTTIKESSKIRVVSLERPSAIYRNSEWFFNELKLMNSIDRIATVELWTNNLSQYSLFYGGCSDKILAFTSLFASTSLSKSVFQQQLRLLPSISQISIDVHSKLKFAFNATTVCAHIRLGDFESYCKELETQSKQVHTEIPSWLEHFDISNCYYGFTEMLQKILHHLPKNIPLNFYIASSSSQHNNSTNDSNNKGNLGAINATTTFSVFTKKDMFERVENNHKFNDYLLPFLEQELCSLTDIFIGNSYSTFSRRISLLRKQKDKPVIMQIRGIIAMPPGPIFTLEPFNHSQPHLLGSELALLLKVANGIPLDKFQRLFKISVDSILIDILQTSKSPTQHKSSISSLCNCNLFYASACNQLQHSTMNHFSLEYLHCSANEDNRGGDATNYSVKISLFPDFKNLRINHGCCCNTSDDADVKAQVNVVLSLKQQRCYYSGDSVYSYMLPLISQSLPASQNEAITNPNEEDALTANINSSIETMAIHKIFCASIDAVLPCTVSSSNNDSRENSINIKIKSNCSNLQLSAPVSSQLVSTDYTKPIAINEKLSFTETCPIEFPVVLEKGDEISLFARFPLHDKPSLKYSLMLILRFNDLFNLQYSTPIATIQTCKAIEGVISFSFNLIESDCEIRVNEEFTVRVTATNKTEKRKYLELSIPYTSSSPQKKKYAQLICLNDENAKLGWIDGSESITTELIFVAREKGLNSLYGIKLRVIDVESNVQDGIYEADEESAFVVYVY